MIITKEGINDATCGQVTRLEQLGFRGEITPFVYGYIVNLHTAEHERLEQKTCKDIYELIDFLDSIREVEK